MRILALNWRDPRNPEAGGAEIHLHEILKRAVAAGHLVTQISQAVKGLPSSQIIDGVRILRHGRRNTFNFSVRRFALGLNIRDNFDLVVEDLCKVPFYSPAWSPVPVLTIVPHLFGTTVFREVAFPLAVYINMMEMFIPRAYRNSRFVAISPSTRDDLIRRGIGGDRIDVVPCGIDTDFYSPGPPEAESGRFIYVGRLKRYKGVHLILEAMATLRDTGHDCSLTVLGSGDFLEGLKSICGRLRLEERVTFLGFVSQEEKLNWLRRAWAAVFPSEKEGWGLTVIEANACGTPVVASDSDGLRDSVRDAETGILVRHGDVPALSHAMASLLGDPARRRSMSERCIEWADGFNWSDTATRMIEIMEETASRG